MKAILLLSLVLLATPVLAQPKQVNIALTQEEWQLVLNKVSESSWKDVNSVMAKMISQINAQIAPPPPKEAKPNE